MLTFWKEGHSKTQDAAGYPPTKYHPKSQKDPGEGYSRKFEGGINSFIGIGQENNGYYKAYQ